MSGDGGVDQGLEADAPRLGSLVLYVSEHGVEAAFVYKIHADGWTVDLSALSGEGWRQIEGVKYAGEGDYLGEQPKVGTWTTESRWEGARIWAEENAKRETVPDFPPED